MSANSLGWITLKQLGAEILHSTAKCPARAARDWCQSRGVPYRRDGKVNWVRIQDVQRHLDGIKAEAANDRSESVNAAVAAIQRAG